MKKIFLLFTAFSLFCCVFKLNITSIIYYGNEIIPDDSGPISNYTSYNPNDYLDTYFYKLETNYGYNVKGSCGYIAIGMLLSYYDTFLSDYFISDTYDAATNLGSYISSDALNANSPGINRFYDASLENISNINYYDNYINNPSYYNYYFQYYLLHTYSQYYNYNNTSVYPASLSADEVNSILCDYIENNQYIADYVTINHIESSDVSNINDYVIGLVNNGIPVVALVSRTVGTETYSHATICYDYQNGLIFHWGKDGYTHVNSTNYQISINDIYYFTTTLNHSCSNNYYYNNTFYCSCDYCNNVNHTHNYTYGTYNNTTHNLICNTSSMNAPHSFTYEYYDASFHTTSCDCGFNQYQQHAVAGGSTGLTRCLFCNALVNVGIVPFGSNYIIIELNDGEEIELYFYLYETIALDLLYNGENDEEDEEI